MIGVSLIVLVIAQPRTDPVALAFERAARGVLGPEAHIALLEVELDPPDDESAARAATADGVIELSWTGSGESARIHCYVARERRWVDREIQFSPSSADPRREASERGRLLGLAAATMFSADADEAAETSATPSAARNGSSNAAAAAAVAKPAEVANPGKAGVSPASDSRGETRAEMRNRVLEFAGTLSGGIHGTAAGLGASAGARLAWSARSGRDSSLPGAPAASLKHRRPPSRPWAALASASDGVRHAVRSSSGFDSTDS